MQIIKNKLLKEFRVLQRELLDLGPILRGSVVTLNIKSRKKMYPAFYFSMKSNNRTKILYLGTQKVPLAREYQKNYVKLKKIIEKMMDKTIRIIKIT